MPKRPPKRWWNSCINGVKKKGSSYSPESVCGSEWFHKKTQKERSSIVRREEARKRKK